MQLKSKSEEKLFSTGRWVPVARRLLDALFEKSLVSVKEVQAVTGLTPKTANQFVNLFIKNGILLSPFKQMKMKIDFRDTDAACVEFLLHFII